jgi:hypothetical protein
MKERKTGNPTEEDIVALLNTQGSKMFPDIAAILHSYPNYYQSKKYIIN